MAQNPPPDDGILGLDNVRLELPIAGAATRSLAGALDVLVLSIAMVALVAAVIGLGAVTGLDGPWVFAALVLGLFALQYGYFAVSELVLDGQTLGKKAIGIRVVARDGARAGTAAVLVRNVVRAADMFVGVPLMMIDPLARRLGDRLAGTLVVLEDTARADLVVRRVPRGWTGAEVAVAEDFLRRSRSLEPARAEAMAGQLLAAIHRADPDLLAGEWPARDRVAALRRALGTGG